ncbi:hypothetical protein Cgig2_009534 [Carnegiea gigantea]|uniref:Uncharacterized protein n=1 Tax=Carnegiea gigantea TaxID=171969 RepID=A0A9Q1QGL0_9CARY|nr:hypothetical protein Cgig2_009534 [Carnegiea gigantea]
MGSQHKDADSSSSDEDGDEEWKAAINAVASVTASTFLGCPPPPNRKPTSTPLSEEDDEGSKSQRPLKHYQIKAQKALYGMLEKSLVFVKDTNPMGITKDDPEVNEGGVRLFKNSPLGIVFDHKDEPKGPRKKPRILPGEEIDEKSKKFKRRVQSVVVEGMDILASAKDACQKSRVKWETKEAAAREAAMREEERVAQLKKIRGEEWLPSIAREMQGQSRIH